MNIGMFALGAGACAYAVVVLALRLTGRDRYFRKLGPMRERWGQKTGSALHYVGYVAVPLVFGVWTLTVDAFGPRGTEAVENRLTAPPALTAEAEDGFQDLVLFIEKDEKQPDGGRSIHAAGIHNGERVGLEISLGAQWRAGVLDEQIALTVYQGEVAYVSTGAESDALIRAMDDLYGTRQAPRAMRPETRFTAITLEGDPHALDAGPIAAKLFFDADEEENYAELFTNIDLKARRIEIREKDSEYRGALVRALLAR